MRTYPVAAGRDRRSVSRVLQSTGRTWLTVALMLAATPAFAVPIDLTKFTAIPQDPVAQGLVKVAPSGDSAVLTEDLCCAFAGLNLDPVGFDDPDLIDPDLGSLLRFDYALSGAFSAGDAFVVTLFDSAIGGPTTGMLRDFELSTPGAGTLEFDLRQWSNAVFGLDFELQSGPIAGGLDAVAEIFNLELVDPDSRPPVSVPEPQSLGLLLFGLAALLLKRRSSI